MGKSTKQDKQDYQEDFESYWNDPPKPRVSKIKSKDGKPVDYHRNVMAKYTGYIGGAKKRLLKFELTYDQFEAIVSQPCYYCGYKDIYDKPNGVDRVDNIDGYVLYNCVPCCSICNRMKWIMTKNEFINHCKIIAKRH